MTSKHPVRIAALAAAVLLAAGCKKEAEWGPPVPPAPEWAEHVLSQPLATGHHYLRFDIPPPHTDIEVERFYAVWIERQGWTRKAAKRGPAVADVWTDFQTTDGSGGSQRFVRWVSPSLKWSCRVGLTRWNQGPITADVVLQPSREVPIDAGS